MNKFRRVTTGLFEELGLKNSLELTVKADAVLFIITKMDEAKITQTALAAQIGWSRPRLSDLLRGKLSLFSYEKINEALAPFGASIEIQTKLKLPSSGRKAAVRAKAQHPHAA